MNAVLEAANAHEGHRINICLGSFQEKTFMVFNVIPVTTCNKGQVGACMNT